MVQLGDDDGARRARVGALVPQHRGQAVDAVGGGDGEEGGVGRSQACPQVTDEVGVAGSVQEVHLDVVVHERRQGQVDRALLPDLDLVEIADGAAVLHAAGPLDRACRGEQRLSQRRLPGSGVADQHNVAHVLGLAGRWCPAGGARCCLLRHTTASLCSCSLLLLVPAFTHCSATTSPRPQSARLPLAVPRPRGPLVKRIDQPPVRSNGHAEGAETRPCPAADASGEGSRAHPADPEHADGHRGCRHDGRAR